MRGGGGRGRDIDGDDASAIARSPGGVERALHRDGVVEVRRERVGIVGESGSGKSMTGRAILRLVRPPGEATARTIAFEVV